jgi:hypothetical protein
MEPSAIATVGGREVFTVPISRGWRLVADEEPDYPPTGFG